MITPETVLGTIGPDRSGLEVHLDEEMGWTVFASWNGEKGGPVKSFETREEANVYATELLEDAAAGIIGRIGSEPYLKLAEAPDATS